MGVIATLLITTLIAGVVGTGVGGLVGALLQKDSKRMSVIESVAPYFDGAYFAERITIPVRLSVGYADVSCSPQSVLSAYNAIPSKDKKLYHGIGGVHGSPNAPANEVREWLEK